MEKFIQTKLIPELITVIETKFRELPEYLAEELQVEESDVSSSLTKFYGEISKKIITTSTTTVKKTEPTRSTGMIKKSSTPSPLQNKNNDDKISQYKAKIAKSKIKEGYLNLDSGRAVKKNDGNIKKFDFNETLKIALPKNVENNKIFATLTGEEPEPQTLIEKKNSEKKLPIKLANKKTTPTKKETNVDTESDDEKEEVKVSGLAAKKTGMVSAKKAPVKTTSTLKNKFPVIKMNESGLLVDNQTNFVWDDEPNKNGKIIGVWNPDEDDYDELDDDDINVINKNNWRYEVKEDTADTDTDNNVVENTTTVSNKITNLLKNEKPKQVITEDSDSDFSDDE